MSFVSAERGGGGGWGEGTKGEVGGGGEVPVWEGSEASERVLELMVGTNTETHRRFAPHSLSPSPETFNANLYTFP